ncbi:MAG TPA: TIGR02587 family membrane protein [Pyrinomonadaceae bacterium]|jgi:putative integral membrane protein (TIGR02587 family)
MSHRSSKKRSVRTVAESLQEYGRGVAGGLIVSLPLLYTMEVWWVGFIAHPWRLLAYIVATFVLLLGYNRYAGLRRDASMTEVAIDSVEEMGIGFLVAALALFLLGRITSDMAANEVVGRIVIEAMTVAIGVSVGTAQLGGGEDDEGFEGNGTQARQSVERRAGAQQARAGKTGGRAGKDDKGEDGEASKTTNTHDAGMADKGEIHFGGQVVIAFCGAVLFAANVAPTEEIVMIASEISSWRLFALASLSLLMGALILHFSEFTGAENFVPKENFMTVVVGTVVTYALALAASMLILFFFGRFDGEALITCLAQTVVLGVAATLGASAGRLLLQ